MTKQIILVFAPVILFLIIFTAYSFGFKKAIITVGSACLVAFALLAWINYVLANF